MDPQIRRRRTLEAIKRIILRESLEHALVVIFEDLHWIDSETQALLDLLADSGAGARLLLFVNYRPEYRHEWSGRGHYLQLRLDPLDSENGAAMLAALFGGGVELEALKRLIIERTEGNPFFIEEMVQALFDAGALVRNGAVKLARSLSQLRLPTTVQGILASRIDRLSAEQKELLQTLAVIGRESPLGLIRKVASKAEAQLERMLADLRAAEFIYEQPALTDSIPCMSAPERLWKRCSANSWTIIWENWHVITAVVVTSARQSNISERLADKLCSVAVTSMRLNTSQTLWNG
jgi:predicted ATPase